MKPLIAIVAPNMALSGGVTAVVSFIRRSVVASDRYEAKLISLATSAWDDANVSLFRPQTWLQGVRVKDTYWENDHVRHVGALLGELEFQRYRRRSTLTREVSDCDLIQVVGGSPACANAVCGLGIPVALQCATRAKIERRRRDSSPVGAAGWWRKAMTPITDLMDDIALRSVDAIQVENPQMLAYARSINVAREVDIRYAPPGVDADLFMPSVTRTWQADKYILCVGRLADPRKNIGLLLEAYVHMPVAVQRSVRLVLAGASPPPESFWEQASRLGVRSRVAYSGRLGVADLITLMQQAAAFVLPSDEEGLGVVLLEAMSCGVPVVSTRSGGPDGIITEGKDGFLVPLNDAALLGKRLSQLMEDVVLNQTMGQNARHTIESRYAERVTARQFIDTWDCLVAKRPAPRRLRNRSAITAQ